MDANIDNYRDRITASATDSNELDKLIKEMLPESYDASFLTGLDEQVVEGILKSQQSKRSRAKSKAMTMENYMTLMTAAVAENIIREVTGRAKTIGSGRIAGTIDFTGAQLEALAEDQDALRREIRNIQSKKSIMKSKADFSEADERWLMLLKAEQQLKDLRVGTVTQVVEVDKTKEALADVFEGIDISKLKSSEAHDLLETIKGLLGEPAPVAEETN